MKRLRRWVFNGFAALSLAMCVATIYFWVRFHQNPEIVRRQFDLGGGIIRTYTFASFRGKVSFQCADGPPLAGWTFYTPKSVTTYPPPALRFRIFASYWELTVAFAILPTARLVAWLRRPRREIGKCPSCGYDLRATPERCPECGTIPAKKEMISD